MIYLKEKKSTKSLLKIQPDFKNRIQLCKRGIYKYNACSVENVFPNPESLTHTLNPITQKK